MTTGDKIWRDAVVKIGVARLWQEPKEALPDLGREIVEQIDRALRQPRDPPQAKEFLPARHRGRLR